ncbi:MAG: prepilin-type N-terminal cleavage/methylation domain-containing protein [Bacilli bacterium]|nr:prepilin-type N-terminal cleavage/methylation domain-containing protein [Bacilli bacterium]
MKNKKGFTVVELIASFALTMIISVFLFEVLLDVKDIFIETSIKTSIQEKVSIISKNIKLNLPHAQINCSGNSCTAGSNIITVNSNNVRIGSQTIKTPSFGGTNVTINDIVLNAPACSGNNCTLKVHFNLTHPNLKEPYNYTVVYYYSIG